MVYNIVEMKQKVEEAAKEYAKSVRYPDTQNYGDYASGNKSVGSFNHAFMAGAEWQSKQSPWINVNERLPEEFEDVLVLFEHKGKPMIQTDAYFGEINGCWKFGEDKILAWMPVPPFDEILEANKEVLKRIKEKGD